MMSSIEKYLNEYLDYLEIEKNRSKLTRRNYEHYLKRFITFAKISSPEEITLDLVRKFRLYLNRLEDAKGRPLKKLTQQYYVIAIRNFLKYLSRRDLEVLAPEKIELGKTPSRELDIISEEELKRLLESSGEKDVRGLRDRAMLEILFSTGLRVSELCRLNRDETAIRNKEFSVRGKGDKIRLVFLSDDAQKFLKNYLAARKDTDEALFIEIGRNYEKTMRRKDSLRITPRTVERIVKKYAVKAGISKKVTPHQLRHLYATDLLRNGADLRSVQALLGHASLNTTQVYTHLTDRTLKEIHRTFHDKDRGK